MSIADKLTTIAENMQRVYDAGKAAGGGSSADGWYDTFWDAYQDNGARTDYSYAFYGKGWLSSALKPKYNLAPVNATYMFANQRVEKQDLPALLETAGVTLDFSSCTNLTNAFYNGYFTRIGVVSTVGATGLANTFNGLTFCETIEEVILKNDGSQTFTNTFLYNSALKNIRFSGVIGKSISFANSPLSVDSMQNIISCLKNYSGTGTTQTLTLGTTNLEKLTDAEKAIATQKGWTLA